MSEAILTLGQGVRFTRTLQRASRYDTENFWTVKRWTTERWTGDTAEVPARDGILVGIRVLQNGHSVGGYYDEPAQWVVAHSFTAYLVAFHLRRKPVLVLPEHLTPLGDTDV